MYRFRIWLINNACICPLGSTQTRLHTYLQPGCMFPDVRGRVILFSYSCVWSHLHHSNAIQTGSRIPARTFDETLIIMNQMNPEQIRCSLGLTPALFRLSTNQKAEEEPPSSMDLSWRWAQASSVFVCQIDIRQSVTKNAFKPKIHPHPFIFYIT